MSDESSLLISHHWKMTLEHNRLANQLEALARVSSSLNASLQMEGILRLVTKEAVALSRARGGQISLWDAEANAFSHCVTYGALAPWDLEQPNLPAALVNDEKPEPTFGWHGEQDSCLTVPILFETAVAGLIRLFNPVVDDQLLTFLQILATHAAIAIGNERRFTELRQRTTALQQRARQIQQFVESGRVLKSDQPLTEVYDQLVHAIQGSLGFRVVLLSLIEENDPEMRLQRVVAAGLPLQRLRQMQRTAHPWREVIGLMSLEHALGGAYFVPAEEDPGLDGVRFHHVGDLYPAEPAGPRKQELWNDDDIFFIPLRDSTGRPLGLISLDAPEDGRRPDIHVAKALEIFAYQTATAIENSRLYYNTRAHAERLKQLNDELDRRVAERTIALEEESERVRRLLQAERVEAAKSEAILQSIADGVLVADERGRIILANQPASELLATDRAELIGKSVKELLGLYGSMAESWLDAVERWARQPGQTRARPYRAEQIMVEDKVLSVHLSPVVGMEATRLQFLGTVSIFRDITREVEVVRMKSEFVSTVSHELRTPMTSITGYVDLLLMGVAGELTERQTRYLQVVKNNADRLHVLVGDLLDISQMETGKTELNRQATDLKEVIGDAIESYWRKPPAYREKQLTLETDLAPDLPPVWADRQRLIQVLTNLLDNAYKYTPDGGRVIVQAKRTGKDVSVSIIDNGIGISEENQAKVFDRFFRAEDAAVQDIPGTGLGLSIVQRLIEMHSGRLVLQSQPGKGSRFTFTLPVLEAEAVAMTAGN